MAPLEAAQDPFTRAGRLLPRVAAQQVARRRRVHRPDRGAGVRDAREPGAHLSRPQLPRSALAAPARLASSLADRSLHVSLGFAVAQRLALVVEVLSPRERDLDLGVGA